MPTIYRRCSVPDMWFAFHVSRPAYMVSTMVRAQSGQTT
ncbi:hypothetical protein J2S92_003949 [Arthrobacter bambusae]|nr:hypothetical protein [Arthrobacter bambusae]MDQ0237577.1 hypothetical protein [Arthrobacter bambusae]